MARKKKKKRKGAATQDPGATVPSAPDKLSRPFADALRGLSVEEEKASKSDAPTKKRDRGPVEPVRRQPSPPEPPPPTEEERPEAPYADYSYEDRVAMSQAYADVRPLGRRDRVAARRPVAPPAEKRTVGGETESDAQARARLAALVAGGLRFEVAADEDGNLRGRRAGSDPQALKSLRGGKARPDAGIDLHGMTAAEAEREVVRFVRRSRDRGLRVVRIVHGKGLHSEGGLGVLGDRVVHALTEGGAAPFVLAFVSAAPRDGGRGALLVRLTR